MSASTLSYTLDGIAARLREGLGNEVYALQEAARMLRLPREERRPEILDRIQSARDVLDSVSDELRSAAWMASIQIEPEQELVTESPQIETSRTPDLDEIPF